MASESPIASSGTGAASGPGEAPLGPASERCTDEQIGITFVDSFAAAGNVGGWLRFLNTSDRACWLHGWPQLRTVTAAGAAIVAERNTSGEGSFPGVAVIPTVTLEPGDDAFAAFGGGDNPEGPSATCPPPYRMLEAALPGGTRFVRHSAYLPYLAAYLPSCTAIGVTVIVRAGVVPYLRPFRP